METRSRQRSGTMVLSQAQGTGLLILFGKALVMGMSLDRLSVQRFHFYQATIRMHFMRSQDRVIRPGMEW